jgi:hypothetical protein
MIEGNPLEEALESPQDDQQEQAQQDPLEGREDLQKALYRLAQKVAGYDKYARRQEVMDVRQQRFYWRGVQYIWWNEQAGYFVAAPQSGTQLTVGGTDVDMPRYTDAYEIYAPFGRALIAAFTQNQPGVRFQAEDPTDGADITAKTEAEKYRHYFDRSNDNKKLQQDMARLYCTDARCITYTYWDEEEQKEKTQVYGVLESKVPITARDIKGWNYCILSGETDIDLAKEKYPDKAEKIKSGPSGIGESDYERFARLGVLQGSRSQFQTGEAYSHLVTEHYVFFRPAAFRSITRDKKSGKPDEQMAQELRDIFPGGACVTFIGETYVTSRAQDMDRCLAVSFPLPGDGMARPSMLRPCVTVQDAVNDALNLWKEIYDYMIPVTYMNCGWNDINALRTQMSEPGNHMPFKKQPGESMEDQFYRESPAAVSPDFMEYVQFLVGNFAQFVTGALPALFGGGDKDNQTKGGIAMMREQALGQMSLPWGSMQSHFAIIYGQAAQIAAEMRGDKTVSFDLPEERGANKVQSLNFAALGGNILCYPDTDTSFPETYSAKRAVMFQFMQMAGPEAIQFLMTPNNMEVMKDLLGIEELENPQQEACEQQRIENEKLTKEAPMPDMEGFMKAIVANKVGDMMGQATGQPPQMQPPLDPNQFLKSSVPIDVEMDDHVSHANEGKRVMASPAGQQMKVENPQGFQNLRLHTLEHLKAAAAQMMPPPMMPGAMPPHPAGPPPGTGAGQGAAA